jgi:hypothetical protein
MHTTPPSDGLLNKHAMPAIISISVFLTNIWNKCDLEVRISG